MGKMLIVGSSALDLILGTNGEALTALKDGGKAFCEEKYEMRPGGRAVHAALCARLFGRKSAILSVVGKDGNASRLRNFLYENGVDTGALFTDTASQTSLNLIIKEGGEPFAPFTRKIVYSGAAESFKNEYIEKVSELDADSALIQCELPGDFVLPLVRVLRELSVSVFADMTKCKNDDISPYADIGNADVIFLSHTAAEKYTGIECAGLEKCLKCCMELSRSFSAKYILIKLDTRGIFVYDGKFYNIVSPCDPPIASKAGAADVLSSAIASLYFEKGNITAGCEAGLIAQRIAKENLSVFIPSIADVKRFAAEGGLNVHF